MIIWTSEADLKLRELWATGLSASKIGREIGATKNAVIGRASRIKLERRACPIVSLTVPDKVRDEIKRALLDEVPVAHVIRRTGASLLSVKRVQAEMPLLPERQRAPFRMQAEIPALPPVAVMVVPEPPAPTLAEPPAPWQPERVTVFAPPKPHQCQWVEGNGPFIQCEAIAVREPGMKPPYSYCMEHRKAAYAPRAQEHAA